MNRVTYGTCTHCHKKFHVVDWYDLMNHERIQTDTPWTCPGCKDNLKTNEIIISYEYEGDS